MIYTIINSDSCTVRDDSCCVDCTAVSFQNPYKTLSHLNPRLTPPLSHDLGMSYEMSCGILHLLLIFLPKILTHYSSIIPNSFRCLFSKLSVKA